MASFKVGDLVLVAPNSMQAKQGEAGKVGQVASFSAGRVGVTVNGTTLWRGVTDLKSVYGAGPPKQRAEIGDWVRLKKGDEVAEGQLVLITGGRFRVRLLDGSSLWRGLSDLTLPGEDAPSTPVYDGEESFDAATAAPKRALGGVNVSELSTSSSNLTSAGAGTAAGRLGWEAPR